MTVGYLVLLFFFFFQKGNLDLDIAETGSRAYFGKAGAFSFSWWKAVGLCNVRYVVSVIFRHVSCTRWWEPLDYFIRITPVQNLNPIAVVCERKWRENSWGLDKSRFQARSDNKPIDFMWAKVRYCGFKKKKKVLEFQVKMGPQLHYWNCNMPHWNYVLSRWSPMFTLIVITPLDVTLWRVQVPCVLSTQKLKIIEHPLGHHCLDFEGSKRNGEEMYGHCLPPSLEWDISTSYKLQFDTYTKKIICTLVKL